uniref:Uncharacterized protein n=1 Tax=Naja naja TaxID=35670 RepID=A0A8C7DU79_NAJNA
PWWELLEAYFSGGVVGAPLVLSAVGFTAVGIAAGSLAAKMMSAAAVANGGAVAAGSLVALAQAAGQYRLSVFCSLATKPVVTQPFIMPSCFADDCPISSKVQVVILEGEKMVPIYLWEGANGNIKTSGGILPVRPGSGIPVALKISRQRTGSLRVSPTLQLGPPSLHCS